MKLLSRSNGDTEEPVDGVHLTQLAANQQASIQYVLFEPGAKSPEHSHRHEQLGYVVSGEFTFILGDGEKFASSPGDSYWLESNEVHTVENNGDEDAVAIDVFTPPRGHPDW